MMPGTLTTERDMDIAILEAMAEAESIYDDWMAEVLGERAKPLPPPDLSQVQTPLPGEAPPVPQAPIAPPQQAPTVGGY